ncbi:hypothetical protein GCK72_019832 [Caenorhabditis remanei]|uniref:SPK domain-containing protein n=1 Tax=Caenorhabditis remanei TaxID=31234 RepID=A0A6A5GF01_CAERE|nr:hypothetical protein GCK72_019832 [Caenorhabditis remanei]KAF1753276.1 hypothetical protein GCK72_019832 [Caenorhabditis remanei]
MATLAELEKEKELFKKFLAEETQNVRVPIPITTMCIQFKQTISSSASVNCLRKRLDKWRRYIHEWDGYDTDTKTKMMFGLSASVHPDFLIELRKEADVELDSLHRIIAYKKKDGSLILQGKHAYQKRRTEQQDKTMMEFLAEKAKTVDFPMADSRFVKEFQIVTGCTEKIHSLELRYPHVKNAIYESEDYDITTKIKMMFISSTKLLDNVLEEIRKDAYLEVDEQKRITKCVANDGCLELEGDHSMSAKCQASKNAYIQEIRQTTQGTSIEEINPVDDKDTSDSTVARTSKKVNQIEINDTIKFLVEKTKNATSPMNMTELTKELLKQRGTAARSTVYKRIQKNRLKIAEIEELDIDAKVRAIFALSVPVTDNFLEELREIADVEIDDQNRISKYEAFDGSLSLKGDHSWLLKTKFGLQKRRESASKNEEVEKDDSVQMENQNHSEYNDPNFPTSSESYKRVEMPEESEPVEKKRKISKENDSRDSEPVSYAIPRGDPFISLKAFFNRLRGVVSALGSPTLNPIKKRIEESIDILGVDDKHIPTGVILDSLESCLAVVTGNVKWDVKPKEESTSFRGFLIVLKASISYFNNPMLFGFHQEILAILEHLRMEDKQIPAENVRTGLEVMIDVVLSWFSKNLD